MKTVHCFVPDCIQHSDTHIYRYLSLSAGTQCLRKFELGLCQYNELRVLFYIQSVRVQAHCIVVDV